MEAVPRLPMLSFDLKISPEPTSFGPKLKQYIRDFYHEDPEMYSNEIHSLESLRALAVSPVKDVTGCSNLKKYYCQLHFLQSRFPMSKDGPAAVSFTWRDTYASMVCTLADITFEMVAVLYNIGALHSQLGASDSRVTADGMKMSCTHFQCAAWAFQHLKDSNPQPPGVDLGPEVMQFMYRLSLAQAQECILEKSMMDNRKSTIIAKVAVQIVDYYNLAWKTLEQGGTDDCIVSETVGSKLYKSWKRYVKFKIAYHSCISLLYQGQQAEEQQKMGERVAFYHAAAEKLEEAVKLSKGMENIEVVNEALTFTNDVVEGKKKAAKNENEFIYHEEVPDRDALPTIKGASLVKGIQFNVNDPDVAGTDIFARLVPMKAHEDSSLYSEEKAKLLRKVGTMVDEKNQELSVFMNCLKLDYLHIHLNSESESVPQELVERCAALNAKPEVIQTLIDSMSKLTDTYQVVEGMLTDIKELLEAEEEKEKAYQEIMGKRPPSIVATDLTREANKYQEAHAKASESNQTLHKAMTLHIANLRILSLPIRELIKQIPTVSALSSAEEQETAREVKHLVDKVEEMSKQRAMLKSQLTESTCQDDITRQLTTRTGESLETIFNQELQKHQRYVTVIEQNMAAQDNILKALTDAYARYAEIIKSTNEIARKREATITALISSYDAYDDLIAKANKGLEFYRKLETNVSKLLQRVKGTCKVQDEEREQILAKNNKKLFLNREKTVENMIPESSGPKLKDYLLSMKRNSTPGLSGYVVGQSATSFYSPDFNQTAGIGSQASANYPDPTMRSDFGYGIPAIRPAPVGSEGTGEKSGSQTYIKQELQQPQQDLQDSGSYKNLAAYSSPSYPTYVAPSTSYEYSMPSYPQNPYTEHTYGGQYQQQKYDTHNVAPTHSTMTSTYPATHQTSYIPNSANYQVYASNHMQYNISHSQHGIQPVQHNVPPMQQNIPPVQQNVPIVQQNVPAVQQNSSYIPLNTSVKPNIPIDNTNPVSGAVNTSITMPHAMGVQLQYVPEDKQQYNYVPVHQDCATSGAQGLAKHEQSYVSNISQTVPSQGNAFVVSPQQAALYTGSQQPYTPSTQHSNPPPFPPSNSTEQDKQSTTFSPYSGENNSLYQYGATYSAGSHYNYPGTLPVTTQPHQNTSWQPSNIGTYDPSNTNYSAGSMQIYYNQNSPVPVVVPSTVAGIKNFNVALSQQNSNPNVSAHQPTYAQNNSDSYSKGYQYMQGAGVSSYTSAGQFPTSQTNSSQTSVEGQTFATQYGTDGNQTSNYNQVSYYNYPYGYQYMTESNLTTPPASPLHIKQEVTTTTQQHQVASPMTYMQAQGVNSNTSTTYSRQNATSSSSEGNGTEQESNIDLLAGLDFSINQQPLIPQQSTSSPKQEAPVKRDIQKECEPKIQQSIEYQSPKKRDVVPNVPVSDPPKSTNIEPKDLSVNATTDESTALKLEVLEISTEEGRQTPKIVGKDPYADTETLNQFVQEVEKFEKFVDGLTTKTLNGPTPLDIKWKELLELQEKDAHKRSISVARCYPMKNRFADILPYDHARVELPSTKDDYINASFIQDLTPHSLPLIVTQAPLQSTYTDFWTMVWERQVEVIACLLSDSELQNQIYWPTEKGSELAMGKMKLQLQSTNIRPNWIERIISVSVADTRITRVVVQLQFTAWPGSSFPASPGPFLSFVSEVLSLYKQQRSLNHPVVAHCLSGVGRTGLFCIVIAAICEIQAGKGLLDIVTATATMSTYRKGSLRDREHLKFAYQAVLYYAQDLLMKRGILTSRSTFEDKRSRGGKSHTRHPSEDFLLGPPAALSQLQSGLEKMGLDATSKHSESQERKEPDGVDKSQEFQESTDSGEVHIPHSQSRSDSIGSSCGSSTCTSPLPTQNSSLLTTLSIVEATNFHLRPDSRQTKSRKRYTRDHFTKNTGSNLELDKGADDDPLSQLDPLWPLKRT